MICNCCVFHYPQIQGLNPLKQGFHFDIFVKSCLSASNFHLLTLISLYIIKNYKIRKPQLMILGFYASPCQRTYPTRNIITCNFVPVKGKSSWYLQKKGLEFGIIRILSETNMLKDVLFLNLLHLSKQMKASQQQMQ